MIAQKQTIILAINASMTGLDNKGNQKPDYERVRALERLLAEYYGD